MGSDEKRLGRTIVRIHAIESTSSMANNDHLDESTIPAALIPSEPEQPDVAYERGETTGFVRDAIATLPPREQKVIGLYYYSEATMKQIGAEIGVNESRVSQLHARAIRRLRDALSTVMPQSEAAKALVIAFQQKPKMAKAGLDNGARAVDTPGVVVDYVSATRVARGRATFGASRDAVTPRKRMVATAAKASRRADVAVAR
jgi:RNA polymerase sigma factor for flagellar operon FliA